MNWIGKILGAIFGYLLLGPVGAFVGFLIGHYFDKGLARDWGNQFKSRGATQQVFFDSVFSVMGCIAKADGRVSERELQACIDVLEGLHACQDNHNYYLYASKTLKDIRGKK